MSDEIGIPRRRVVHPSGGRVLTKQAPKDETDINTIMRKWHATGALPRQNARPPRYGDFASGLDFQAALELVTQAQEDFMELPSRVRSACNNDPAQFLALCADPDQVEKLRELGLLQEQVPSLGEVLTEAVRAGLKPADTPKDGDKPA